MLLDSILLNYFFSPLYYKPQKIKKAIDRSQERYCGVSAMLRKNSLINYAIEYVEDLQDL